MQNLRAIVLCFLAASSAFAADYYVRTSGGSYGLEDGSDYANAWDGKANINWSLLPGNTLFVGGTISGNLTPGQSGTSENPITIKSCEVSYGASDEDPGLISAGSLFLNGTSNIFVYGLEVIGADNTTRNVSVGEGANNILMSDLYVHDGGGVGVGIGSYATNSPYSYNITFQNSTVCSNGSEGIYVSVTTYNIRVSSNTVFRNGNTNYVGNGQGDGIEMKPIWENESARPGTYMIIEGNEIYNPDWDSDTGESAIGVAASGVIVRGNYVHGLQGNEEACRFYSSYYLQAGFYYGENITTGQFYNNIIDASGQDTCLKISSVNTNRTIGGILVANNVFTNFASEAVLVTGSAGNQTGGNRLVNNVAYMATGSVYFLQHSAADLAPSNIWQQVDYNAWYSADGTNDNYMWWQSAAEADCRLQSWAEWTASGCGHGGSFGANSILVDPELTSAFVPSSASSPLVDAGATLSEVIQDYAGYTRPYGSAWDIGAYEFGAGGWPEVPDNPPNRIWIGVP